MKVGYNRALSAAILVVGVAILLLALWSDASFNFASILITGPLMTLAGMLMLFRPQFRYDPTTRTITVVTLIGTMSRRFGGFDGGRLSVAGDRIMCTRADGSTKKVPVSRALARRAEWDAVLVQLE